MPPGQKIRCGCIVGVIDTYVDDIDAALISADDVKMVRQISNPAAMAEGDKHCERPTKSPHVPCDCKNPNFASSFLGDVLFGTAEQTDEEAAAQESRWMPHDSWQAKETAADGHSVIRRATTADEEAKPTPSKK